METDLEIITRIFNEARARGLCKNQKQFADLMGMNPSTISNALQGKERYLTKSVVRRFKSWEALALGENRPGAQPQQDTRPDILIPAATMDLYTSMAKSIDRLTALVERLEPGASAFVGAMPTQKNYQTNGK
jgi:transcriptional regulator with XRE-family HTH domain